MYPELRLRAFGFVPDCDLILNELFFYKHVIYCTPPCEWGVIKTDDDIIFRTENRASFLCIRELTLKHKYREPPFHNKKEGSLLSGLNKKERHQGENKIK
jgi:hypothetical protein